MKYIIEMIADFLYRQKRRKIWHKVVSFMAAVVVFCTTYALILPAITLEKQLICTIDDIEHVHDETCYSSSQQEEVVQRVYTYEGETTTVKVTLPLDSTVPEDATLTVTPIVDTDDTYAELAQKAEDTMEGQSCEVVLFDISFYTAENEYIPVSEEAMVSFEFKENILPEGEGDVTILHYEDETQDPVALENVKVETDENEEMTAVTFQTEGFSVFAMVKVLPASYNEALKPVDLGDSFDINDLHGKRYVITNISSKHMLSNENDDKNPTTRRLNVLFSNVTGGTEKPVYWTFEGANGAYILRSGNQYLKANENSLTVVTSESEASTFKATKAYDGTYGNAIMLQSEKYINLHGGDNAPDGFCMWDATDSGSKLKLYTDGKPEFTMVTGLDGRSYAIVNFNWDMEKCTVAIQNNVITVGTQNRLQAQKLDLLTRDAENRNYSFNSNSDVTLWTFETAGEDGAYYIKDGAGKYINIGTDYNLNLSDEKQKIYVVSHQLYGKLYLKSEDNIRISLANVDDLSQGFVAKDATDSYDFILAEKIKDPYIHYNLNLGGSHAAYTGGNAWQGGTPTVQETQEIDQDGEYLYSITGEKNANGYYVYCENIASSANVSNSTVADIHKYLKDQGKSYGKEFQFLGWTATIDGEEVLFAENAEAIYKDEDIHITDVNGIKRALPIGTVLKGKWKEISDTVLFFVNYSGTILDREGNVSGRNQKEFTPCVGIGRVYNGTLKVGDDEHFALEADSAIDALFTKEYDPNNPDTQIVMEYVAYAEQKDDYKFNQKAEGINNIELMTAVLAYIKNHQEVIKLSTADNANNPQIDPNNADSDHYEVRWYVKKEQADAWHIDGVLVAKTHPIEVVKTFSGLTEAQASGIITDTTNPFGVNVKLKVDETIQDYLTINKNEIAGQFEYHGKAAGINSYSWTFNTVLDEKYVLEETNYNLAGYDCSTIVVVRTNDGIYHAAYGTTTTEAIESVGQYLVGGYAESVSFNNFYTKEGTGTFNLVKRDNTIDSNDPAGKLKDAVFILKKKDTSEVVQTVTTNANGSANFMNVPVGEYTLEEQSAPTGYIKSSSTWTVSVIKETVKVGDVTTYPITVKIKENKDGAVEKILYDKGVMQEDASVIVKNTPDKGTVIITKKFENLSDTDIKALLNDTTNPYQINVSPKSGIGSTYTLTYANRSTVSTDGKTITWQLTGVPSGKYTILERNFRHISAKDTVVNSSTANNVTIDYINQTAQFDMQVVEQKTSNVSITNNYTNKFTLRVIKKDTAANLLSGAVFDVYGEYGDAKDTSRFVTYKDPNTGIETKAYYIGTMTTDSNGVGSFPELELSTSDLSKTYVLKEVTAPTGYALLKEPIVVKNAGPDTIATVSGGGATGTYNNGCFDVIVTNESIKEAKVTVAVEKKWKGVSDTGPAIQLQLWRKIASDETMQFVEDSAITLDGAIDTSETVAWQYEWDNLWRYDDSGNEYTYYVEEIPVAGYTTFYSGDTIDFTESGKSKIVGKTSWNLLTLKYEVTVTNSSSYELPETGGFGTQVYTIGGIVLILLGVFLYRKKRMEVGV